MKRTTTTAMRLETSRIVSRAEFAKERTIIERHGRPVAAIVPIEDLALLEELEDRLDVEEIERALAEAQGQPRISLDEMRKRLGL